MGRGGPGNRVTRAKTGREGCMVGGWLGRRQWKWRGGDGSQTYLGKEPTVPHGWLDVRLRRERGVWFRLLSLSGWMSGGANL